MLSIHLNDNFITQASMGATDIDFYYDCLELFNITEEDMKHTGRSMREDVKINPSLTKKYDCLDIDYRKFLDKYFSFDNHKLFTDPAQIRKQYKDRILMGAERKIVEQYKAMN